MIAAALVALAIAGANYEPWPPVSAGVLYHLSISEVRPLPEDTLFDLLDGTASRLHAERRRAWREIDRQPLAVLVRIHAAGPEHDRMLRHVTEVRRWLHNVNQRLRLPARTIK